MCHQAQKGFCGIFIGIPRHQKGYLVCVPSTRKIISSYYVVFCESFSSVLAYKSQPYAEAMYMRPDGTYTPCAISLRGKTGDIITLAQGVYVPSGRIYLASAYGCDLYANALEKLPPKTKYHEDMIFRMCGT